MTASSPMPLPPEPSTMEMTDALGRRVVAADSAEAIGQVKAFVVDRSGRAITRIIRRRVLVPSLARLAMPFVNVPDSGGDRGSEVKSVDR